MHRKIQSPISLKQSEVVINNLQSTIWEKSWVISGFQDGCRITNPSYERSVKGKAIQDKEFPGNHTHHIYEKYWGCINCIQLCRTETAEVKYLWIQSWGNRRKARTDILTKKRLETSLPDPDYFYGFLKKPCGRSFLTVATVLIKRLLKQSARIKTRDDKLDLPIAKDGIISFVIGI